MTLTMTGREAMVEALLLAAGGIESGAVVSCSLHYEPTSVARLSVCYLTGEAAISGLPGVTGVTVEITEDEETGPC